MQSLNVYGEPANLPIMVGFEFIRQTLLDQVFRGAGQHYRAVDDGSGCYYLDLSQPSVDGKGGDLRVRAHAQARLGKAFAQRCIGLDWEGQIEIVQSLTPVPAGDRIRAVVIKSNLLDKRGEPLPAGNQIWQWINERVHPRMEAVVFDLNPVLQSMRDVLPHMIPHLQAPEMNALLTSLRVANAGIRGDGVQFDFQFDAKPQWRKRPRQEPPLRKEEMRRVSGLMDQLDAFYTEIIKQSATQTLDPGQRAELLAILLDLRYELSTILSVSKQSLRNPVRRLFLQTWNRLLPILSTLGRQAPTHRDMLRLLSFMAAGQALFALDRVTPSLGLDISPDGLRRLARMWLTTTQDVLEYQSHIDYKLRERFGFGRPIVFSKAAGMDIWALLIRSAYAESELNAQTRETLNNLVPSIRNIDAYIPMAHSVLGMVAIKTLQEKPLDQPYHDTYRWLVSAAAWKESCWRQFVRAKGGRQPLRSNAGAVGIMQVMPRIWRGFYEPEKLKWDFTYNSLAGGEILLHYMKDYAIRKQEHLQEGGMDNLARAAYAAYNAGPGKLKRFRDPKATRRERVVDRSFYDKFIQVKQGNAQEVKSCYAGG